MLNASFIKKTVSILTLFALGPACFYFVSQPTEAQGSKEITKERLDVLYEESIAAQKKGVEATVAFAEKHVHSDFEAVMHVSTKIGDAPAQSETMVFTKFEYIRDAKKGMALGDILELESGILTYEISEDGRFADVKDRTYSLTSAKVKTGGQLKYFDMEQFMNCDSHYVVNYDGVIQIKNSTCEVEGKVRPQ